MCGPWDAEPLLDKLGFTRAHSSVSPGSKDEDHEQLSWEASLPRNSSLRTLKRLG